MSETEQQMETLEVDAEALLKAAADTVKGKKLKMFDPLESIPTLAVGKEINPGQVIAGTYVRTDRLASHKFVHARETDENGTPVQYRHILRLANKQLLGIWSVGELKMVFDKLKEGAFIEITYKEKGKNQKGLAQHFFSYRMEETVSH